MLEVLHVLSRIKRKIYKAIGFDVPKETHAELFDSIDEVLMGQKLTIVDVGGAVNLQPHFHKLVGHAKFVVFEPDERSYTDLVNTVNRYSHPEDFKYINRGLAGTNGKRTLYLSNVPTGTSILPVDKDSPFVSEDNSYFFPMKEIEIETYMLSTVLDEFDIKYFDAIKLDVQGAELEILKGIDSDRFDEINAVELEIGLHSVYKDQTTFPEVEKFMKEKGFGLFDLRSNRFHLIDAEKNVPYFQSYFNYLNPPASMSARLHELDAIYFREITWIESNNISKERLLRIVAMYCGYNFFAEAIRAVNHGLKSGKLSKEEVARITNSIVTWNKTQQAVLSNFENLLKKTNYRYWAQYMWVATPSA